MVKGYIVILLIGIVNSFLHVVESSRWNTYSSQCNPHNGYWCPNTDVKLSDEIREINVWMTGLDHKVVIWMANVLGLVKIRVSETRYSSNLCQDTEINWRISIGYSVNFDRNKG